MKVNCQENCGNAPLKEKLRDFNIAFGTADVKAISELLTDDIEWEMVGDKTLSGKQAILNELEKMKEYTASELTIDHIITHGKVASCNGSIVMEVDGSEYAFCDVYELNKSGKNARIKKMVSYGISVG